MPTGKGGYHMLGLFLDIFSQHLWVTKFKNAGTAKTMVDSLTGIFNYFTAAETFMTNSGRHFNNDLVKMFCAKWSCTHYVVAAYCLIMTKKFLQNRNTCRHATLRQVQHMMVACLHSKRGHSITQRSTGIHAQTTTTTA